MESPPFCRWDDTHHPIDSIFFLLLASVATWDDGELPIMSHALLARTQGGSPSENCEGRLATRTGRGHERRRGGSGDARHWSDAWRLLQALWEQGRATHDSLGEAFREIAEKLVRAAEQSHSEARWKAIVKSYLSLESCDHPEHGCPLPALAPELARVDETMRSQVFAELVNYRDRMVPFMPGRRTADKERALFVIFSAMVGAVEIARMLPERAAQERVLASTREFLLRSF
jgi:hypothetical protein